MRGWTGGELLDDDGAVFGDLLPITPLEHFHSYRQQDVTGREITNDQQLLSAGGRVSKQVQTYQTNLLEGGKVMHQRQQDVTGQEIANVSKKLKIFSSGPETTPPSTPVVLQQSTTPTTSYKRKLSESSTSAGDGVIHEIPVGGNAFSGRQSTHSDLPMSDIQIATGFKEFFSQTMSSIHKLYQSQAVFLDRIIITEKTSAEAEKTKLLDELKSLEEDKVELSTGLLELTELSDRTQVLLRRLHSKCS